MFGGRFQKTFENVFSSELQNKGHPFPSLGLLSLSLHPFFLSFIHLSQCAHLVGVSDAVGTILNDKQWQDKGHLAEKSVGSYERKIRLSGSNILHEAWRMSRGDCSEGRYSVALLWYRHARERINTLVKGKRAHLYELQVSLLIAKDTCPHKFILWISPEGSL